MGYNITGLVTNKPLDTINELETNLGLSIEKEADHSVGFEVASKNFKEDKYVAGCRFGIHYIRSTCYHSLRR